MRGTGPDAIGVGGVVGTHPIVIGGAGNKVSDHFAESALSLAADLLDLGPTRSGASAIAGSIINPNDGRVSARAGDVAVEGGAGGLNRRGSRSRYGWRGRIHGEGKDDLRTVPAVFGRKDRTDLIGI